MSSEEDHEGVSQVMIEQFVERRLPIILQMREEVEAGKTLSDGEIEILGRILDKADLIMKYAHMYPEFKPLIARVINTYEEITELALRNEQAANGEPPA